MTWDLAAKVRLAAAGIIAGQYGEVQLWHSARFWALVLLGLAAAAAVYLASCIPWPYGPCLACHGNRGRNPGSTRKRHGRCRVCRGTGERLRVGTRILRASGYKGGRWPS